MAPTITGTVANQTTTAETPVTPFEFVTIGDANAGATEKLTIELFGPGTLAGSGLALEKSGGGLTGKDPDPGADPKMGGVSPTLTYILSGMPADVTSELDALVFTPVNGTPNTSVTTAFTLSDQSSASGTPAVDNTTTTVIDTDPPVALTVTGINPDQATTSEMPINPFGDANNGGTNVDTLTVTLFGSGTLSGAGSVGVGDVYTLMGTAAQLTSALHAIVFTPGDGVPNTHMGSDFGLILTDPVTGGAASDNGTQVGRQLPGGRADDHGNAIRPDDDLRNADRSVLGRDDRRRQRRRNANRQVDHHT